MKRYGVMVVAMLAAAICAVGATNVTSVNAVGFIKTTVADGEWALIALPFEQLDGKVAVTVNDILPDAPDGTLAYYYKDGSWQAESKLAFVGWDPGTTEFIRGDAIFLKAPEGMGPVSVSIMGEVPSALTAPDTTINVNTGWTLLGFAYPSDIVLEDTSLGQNASDGDSIYWWNQQDQKWEGISKLAFVGWDPAGMVLKAGQGYFFNAASGFSWMENKPYMWP
jgi:hypothetical protein